MREFVSGKFVGFFSCYSAFAFAFAFVLFCSSRFGNVTSEPKGWHLGWFRDAASVLPHYQSLKLVCIVSMFTYLT